MIDSGLVGSGRGTTGAEHAQGTPTQSHISPSLLVYEDDLRRALRGSEGGGSARLNTSSNTTVRTAVEQSWQIQDSQDHILALAFRYTSLNPFKVFPLCSAAAVRLLSQGSSGLSRGPGP